MEFCADSAGRFVGEVMGQQMGHDIPTGDGQMSHMHMNGEVVQSFPIFGMQHRDCRSASAKRSKSSSAVFSMDESICPHRANAKLHKRINSFA